MLSKLKNKQQNQKGFTLIEVLLVVAIIAILAGIVILAINPTKQLGDTRNAQRQADVNTVLNAVYQYSIDNQGNIPTTVTSTATSICATNASSCTQTAPAPDLVNLSVLSANGKYLVAIPHDPKTGDATDTHYNIKVDTANGNRVTVTAPDAEQGKTISVTR